MALDDLFGLTVSVGHWLYAGEIPETIEIVAFDCDYFFDRLPAADGRDDWKPYALNGEGRLYYLQAAGDIIAMKPFYTLDAAKQYADEQPWGPITWKDDNHKATND